MRSVRSHPKAQKELYESELGQFKRSPAIKRLEPAGRSRALMTSLTDREVEGQGGRECCRSAIIPQPTAPDQPN